MPARFGICLSCVVLLFAAASRCAPAQDAPVVLDRVVAVVNNHAILSSDIEDELRLSAIGPLADLAAHPNRKTALEQLISRTLIQQQIRHEDLEATHVSPSELQERLTEVRKELPVCVKANCANDSDWKNFLDAHGLTQSQVQDYIRRRMELLAFIETRFRQGIRISHDEIETYYRNTLLPQYPSGAKPPDLEQVAPRIEEILLQQQVNVIFTAWLDNLRKQGDVEILDPALEPTAAPTAAQVGEEQ